MTPTLVRQHRPHQGGTPRVDASARARDWAEIQERMLVPLYEAVYERVEAGAGTRLLGLGCGSGLALLMATARGAAVTGVDAGAPERLALARARLLGDNARTSAAPDAGARLIDGVPADAADPALPPYNLITAFQPAGCTAGDYEQLTALLESAVPLLGRGHPVALAGWGPPERCATSAVLRVAARLTGSDDPELPFGPRDLGGTDGWRPARRDDLEQVAERAGLKPDGSGRVACPFGYADINSAVRGLLSSGLFDAAAGATDQTQVEKELEEALHPYLRPDGTVWMPNVFRYVIARKR
ncbi:SAM-dependent methyltransferase [Streptomyces tsukubensis]|uniref:SAM-dependent methyltransferase n=1 Tax=Streptomyces tsukubensis TaxID=83656 RepID=A0A1V4A6A1_9ACTN|nr:SAM-dependent methyltransferase [Streptomyces tsukubensis]OON76395.1 SAM-dependent methyltransferase [Streptomyces tsukubensis]QFR95972.1 SAM-dependent methyltransferase [Streptomyces tsukubensis]